MPNPITWIIIRDGDIVKDHAIEGMAFANIISGLQRVIDNIGNSKYGKDYKKEDFRLYFKELKQGSLVAPMFPQTYGVSLDGEYQFTNITDAMERLMFTLNTKPDTFIQQLELEITDPLSRIGVLKNLRSLTSSDSLIEIKTSVDRPSEGYFIPQHRAQFLDDLIINYGGTGDVTIHGVIMGFRGDNNSYFIIKVKNGRTINCHFEPEMEELVKSLYKKWVSVTGELTRTQKNYKMDKISTLIEIKSEELYSVGKYVFRQPIIFDVSYNNNDKQWCLVNEELSLYGFGADYNKAIHTLEEEIEGHVISFTEYPNEKHAPDSLILKEKLQQFIDFDEINQIISEKYGSV